MYRPLQNRVFGRCLKNGKGCPKFLEYLYGEISLIWRTCVQLSWSYCSCLFQYVVFEKINYLLFFFQYSTFKVV